jgi:serine/threonine protein kinase
VMSPLSRAMIWALAVGCAGVALALGFRRRGETTRGEARPTTPPPDPAPVARPPKVTLPGLDAPGGQQGSSPAPAGRLFGRYLLIEQLGQGGMSQVFSAVTFGAEGFRRKFVVKRLRPELSHDPAVVAQFIDEAKLGASLVHSNVVPVFDFGKVGEEYFLASEYILGRDLVRLIDRLQEVNAGPLSLPLALTCAHEVLRALEYAHTRLGEDGQPLGLVHRDVSPANVLVSARGEVKLFDFGIVKTERRMTQTQNGIVKGNVNFMSPEQAKGGKIDARADLFSLGLLLYFCLTGDVLYRGETTYALLMKAASGPGPEELARLHALPATAAELLVRALKPNPADRFQTAAAFAEALAPSLRAGPNDLATLMQRLFADEFRAEEQRFGVAGGPPAREERAPPPHARP